MTLTTRRQIVTGDARIVSKGTNKRTHLTIHETANTGRGANAKAHANLQSGGNTRRASWHWQVDSVEAVQSYEHVDIAVHAGNAAGSACSIAIEICVNSDGDQMQAYRNAAILAARICHDERIPLANVVQHNRWSGKNCPTLLRSGKPMGWAAFVGLVSAELARLGNTTAPPTPKPTPPAPTEEHLMVTAEDETKIRKIVADEIAKAVSQQLGEIHRETVQSIPAVAADPVKGVKAVKGTLRWLVGRNDQRIEDILTGKRPGNR